MMRWSPILSSSDNILLPAREAVDAIAHAVMAKDYEPGKRETFRDSMYEEALLYGYLAVARNDLGWATRATERLNQAIDAANQQTGYLGLFGGLTGLGWTVEHISRLLNQLSFPADDEIDSNAEAEDDGAEEEAAIEEDLNAEIDAVVLRNLQRFTPSSPYDLISGLVGFGVYFLERLPKETAMQGIQAVFDHLETLAQHNVAGITWFSGPELLPDWQREQAPNGYYNLGVAHGIPGIIHFLSEVSATAIVDQGRSRRLLEGAVNWLLAQRRPSGSRSAFSSWIVPGQEPSDSRLAWCYGDVGILSVLLQVARRAGRDDWQKFANDLLDHCLAWPPDQAGVGDAPLCHGAAGVAHIFNRIYQSQGDSRCRDAALAWYQRTLAMRHPGTGVGGFSALTRPDPAAPIVWESSPAFLDGAIGVALALLAAMTPVEPAWDRMLLLSARTVA
ncbi:MAG: lanthionine synthetase C family protein [Candidatus Sulfotelmatobacter sp.]